MVIWFQIHVTKTDHAGEPQHNPYCPHSVYNDLFRDSIQAEEFLPGEGAYITIHIQFVNFLE